MPSLLEMTIRSYIWLGVFLYAVLFALNGENSISWYNALNVFTFACYALALWVSSNWAESHYTPRNLGLTIFGYSIVILTLYLLLSAYYTDNTFMFSEDDARLYEKASFSRYDMPISEWIPDMMRRNVEYGDWGAGVIFSLIVHIIPSKLFVNFCDVILNTISGLCLFKIGKGIMHCRYAYLAALAYSTSSYCFFFMGSFLKEIIFVFWVVLSLYFLYLYHQHDRLRYLVMAGLASLVVIFFRPPVTVFIWMAFMTMFFIKTKNGVFRGIGILAILVVFVAALGMIQDASEKYGNDGEAVVLYQKTNTFQKSVLYAGALIGPFPRLLLTDDEMDYKPIFGSGLLFKLLLFFAFWKGLWFAVRNKRTEVMPIYAFVLSEVFALFVAMDGLELRKSMPHVPFVVLAAFWFLSAFDNRIESEEEKALHHIQTMRQFKVCILIVIGAVLVWNLR